MDKMKKTGPTTSRDSKGWEYRLSGKGGVELAGDSARIQKEQADAIQREGRGKATRRESELASEQMGNPARYAEGGEVRGYGAARKPMRGCKGA